MSLAKLSQMEDKLHSFKAVVVSQEAMVLHHDDFKAGPRKAKVGERRNVSYL